MKSRQLKVRSNHNSNKKVNKVYYIQNDKEKNVIHLIMASQYSEADEYYKETKMVIFEEQFFLYNIKQSLKITKSIKFQCRTSSLNHQ